eukprot:1160814-Pelagomonas_calceolata.AAC.15
MKEKVSNTRDAPTAGNGKLPGLQYQALGKAFLESKRPHLLMLLDFGGFRRTSILRMYGIQVLYVSRGCGMIYISYSARAADMVVNACSKDNA